VKVQLLGTGSADGWPNPFCRCASCRAAAIEPRAQTAALVDDVILLDCGPDVPRSAARLGINLSAVGLILLTHDHPDHTAASAALYRSWAMPGARLRVVGAPEAVGRWRNWTPDADATGLLPGDVFDWGAYRVRAVGGTHTVPSLLFDIAAPGGRMLYASDTGPLSEASLESLAGARFDIVLMEETFGGRTDLDHGHLNLVSFAEQLRRLRSIAAVTDDTTVAAVHLSHHNPPPLELAELLSAWQVRLPRDGDIYDSSANYQSSAATAAVPRPGRTLVTGGVRSGKSRWAEMLLAPAEDVRYVATAGGYSNDPDWGRRLAVHRARRPKAWQTIESLDLIGLLATTTGPVLIDDLGNWVARTIDRTDGWNGDLAGFRDAADELITAWRNFGGRAVMVTNEVGAGVHPEAPSGRIFRDELGFLNAALAAGSDDVVLLTAGFPQWLRRSDRPADLTHDRSDPPPI
jgi:adenosylcobinamide kinase/adenosylcobinamide-phosphate guanylyltransferase